MMKRTRRLSLLMLAWLACRSGLGASLQAESQAAAAPPVDALTIPAGQKFIMRLETPIHTHSTKKGDRVEFSTAGDVLVENRLAIPTPSAVRATVMRSKRAGRLAGKAEVEVRLDEVRLNDGTVFPLKATIIRVGFDPVDTQNGPTKIKGESGGGGGTAKAVASAGLQGAIIGVMVAGGQGAMYGSAIGAGIQLASMVFKRGPDLDLPQDTMFEAKFDQALQIPMAVAQRAAQNSQVQAAEAHSPGTASEDPAARSKPVLQKPVLHRTEPAESKPAEAPAEPAQTPLPADPGVAVPPELEAPKFPPPAETVPATETAAKPPVPVPAESRPDDAGTYTLRVNVRMVLVDTVVRDRGGRLLENLKVEDFRVFEDGAEQPVQNLSRDEMPLAVALVIDRSGSVSPYINELRRIAYQALQQLKPQDRVALFSFAGSVDRIEDLTSDRRRIVDGIARIRAGGGTDIIDALYDATTYLARTAPDHRRAIILISDNQATVHPSVSEGETIRTAMETETVVYSVRTGGEGVPIGLRLPNLVLGAGSVSKVTQETGGEIIDARQVNMLDTALAAVISRLRLRYSVGYYPPGQERGGAFHTIEVRLADRLGKRGVDYFIHARRGYYSTDLTSPRAKP